MFVALRDLRVGRGRFALVAAVVALIALLTTILSGLANGLVDDGISGLRALPITHLSFQPGADNSFSRSTLNERNLEPFERAHDVEATPIGMSFLNSKSSNGASLDLALFGVDPKGFLAQFSKDKQAVDSTVLNGGIVLSSEYAGKVKVGDQLTISGADKTLPVRGFTFSGSYGHVPIAYTSLDTWRSLTYGGDPHGRFSAIALRTSGNADLRALDEQAGTHTVTKTQAYSGSPGFSAETGTMTLIRTFLLVIAALVVGAFFTVWTIQRARQIALMKALGASNGYVLRDALGQLALVLLVAITAGTLVGVGVGSLLGGSAPFALTVRSVVSSAVLLAVLAMAGSLVALRRITKVDPAIPLGAEP